MLLPSQIVAVVAALLTVILLPAPRGFMLVLPLDGSRAGTTMQWASQAGGTLVARGPIPGSIVVFGMRGRLTAAALRHASLLLAAAPQLCSTTSAKDA